MNVFFIVGKPFRHALPKHDHNGNEWVELVIEPFDQKHHICIVMEGNVPKRLVDTINQAFDHSVPILIGAKGTIVPELYHDTDYHYWYNVRLCADRLVIGTNVNAIEKVLKESEENTHE